LLVCGVAARLLDAAIWGGGGGSTMAALFQVEISIGYSLIHPFHGLFSWSPIVVLALLGCISLARHEPRLALACVLVLASQLWLNGISFDYVVDARKGSRHWGGGVSFGARRWCVMAPSFVLGLAALARAAAARGRAAVAALAVAGGLAVAFAVGLAVHTR